MLLFPSLAVVTFMVMMVLMPDGDDVDDAGGVGGRWCLVVLRQWPWMLRMTEKHQVARVPRVPNQGDGDIQVFCESFLHQEKVEQIYSS